jgi:hypothetical protein
MPIEGHAMCTALEPKVATGRCTLTGHKFVPMNNSVYKQHKLISVTVLRKCGIAQTLPRGYADTLGVRGRLSICIEHQLLTPKANVSELVEMHAQHPTSKQACVFNRG